MKALSKFILLASSVALTGCFGISEDEKKDEQKSEEQLVERLDKKEAFSQNMQEMLESVKDQKSLSVSDLFSTDGVKGDISVKMKVPAGEDFKNQTSIDFTDDFAEAQVDVSVRQVQDLINLRMSLSDDNNTQDFIGSIINSLSSQGIPTEINSSDIEIDIFLEDQGGDYVAYIKSPAIFKIVEALTSPGIDVDGYGEFPVTKAQISDAFNFTNTFTGTRSLPSGDLDVNTDEPGGEYLDELIKASGSELFVKFTNTNHEKDEKANGEDTEKYSYSLDWDEIFKLVEESNKYAVATEDAEEINQDEMDSLKDALKEDVSISGDLWIDKDGVIQKSSVSVDISCSEELFEALESTGSSVDRSLEGIEMTLKWEIENDSGLSMEKPEDTFDGEEALSDLSALLG